MIENLLGYRDMINKALEDGHISEDEHSLLKLVSENYGIYDKALGDALEDGIIDAKEERKLRDIRKKIYEEALITALSDGIITEEERKILKILKKSSDLSDAVLDRIESKAVRKLLGR